MEMKSTAVNLGRTLITPGAQNRLDPEDVMRAMRRHAKGDWGDCTPEDWAANDAAYRNGDRIFSVFSDRYGTRFWIITEADRSATTVLLPNEY